MAIVALVANLFTIVLNILVPVFALVLTGYIAGPRLGLEPRTLTRYAYFILTPAFIFSVLARTHIEAGLVVQMSIYMACVEIGCAVAAFLVARLLRRSPRMTAVYISAAVFGNVGNFGLPIIQFARGEEALGLATIYFLIILVMSFVIGVGAANWQRSGGLAAVLAVAKTPALIVVPPAIFFNWSQIELPLVITRPVDLLAGALIPTMLIGLGVQLASVGIPRPNLDMVVASSIRLIIGPLIAAALSTWFAIGGQARDVGILQSSMPIAILVSIIASEYDMEPAFVTAAVLFSTLASIISLAVVIALLQA